MMLTSEARTRLQEQMHFLQQNLNNLVIDADTHLTDTLNMPIELKKRMLETDNYYHGKPVNAEDLIKEMDMAGVNMALAWQNPAAITYSRDQESNYHSLLKANEYIFKMACKYPTRIIPAGWTDPKALGVELAKELARFCVEEFGFAIVKMNPAQNAFPITDERVADVLDYIVELAAVPAFHFGADTIYTSPEGLAEMAKRHPEHPLLGVHMGGGGASYLDTEYHCEKARQYGLELPNLHFILSAKRDTHIESDLIAYTIAGEPFLHHLFCASDAPYGRMAWNFGGYKAMFDTFLQGSKHTDKRIGQYSMLFTPEKAKDYMGRNFARFIISITSNLLKS